MYVFTYVRSKYQDCKTIQPTPFASNLDILWIQGVLYYIACCCHPPKSRYPPSQFCDQLSADVYSLIASYPAAVIIVAGDFNHLDLSFFEVQYGYQYQIITDVTHGNNVLDKVFVNRPDIYSATDLHSLLKTKHSAVLVHPPTDRHISSKVVKCKKVFLYDIRQNNIDRLRQCLGTFDLTPVLDYITLHYITLISI